MKVAISGASGLIGGALAEALAAEGQTVLRLVRRAAKRADEIAWDPGIGAIARAALESVDAVVHLAGAGIADRRWSTSRKAEILASRVNGTSLLAETIAGLSARPRVFLSASAVGYYGSRGEERLTESSESGAGFLAEVCRAWESAVGPAERSGVRTVRLRFGVVLSRRGGALAKMLPAFKFGLGGPLGSGGQGFSWIALDDVVAAIKFVVDRADIAGPVNVVAPHPVPQRELARALGRVLGRPAFVPMPAFAVRALFGDMGREALLGGQFVVPEVLSRAGFQWRAPVVERALASCLASAAHRHRANPAP